ncbi:MAG: hypothetical protein ACM4AI_15425 [Acidobacteriota bacterium]
MDDESLVRLFERTEVPPDGFRHRDHVRVAWWYLRQHPFPEALARFGANLRRFAVAQGKPDLYHETITTGYLLLINERLDGDGRELAWEEFVSRNGDLMTWKPSILARYYRKDTLASPRAKRTFVMPDRLQPADAINERAKSEED